MAAKNGTFLNPFVNDPHRGSAPLYASLFLIAGHTISQFQSLRAHVPFLSFLSTIPASPLIPTFANGELSAGFVSEKSTRRQYSRNFLQYR